MHRMVGSMPPCWSVQHIRRVGGTGKLHRIAQLRPAETSRRGWSAALSPAPRAAGRTGGVPVASATTGSTRRQQLGRCLAAVALLSAPRVEAATLTYDAIASAPSVLPLNVYKRSITKATCEACFPPGFSQHCSWAWVRGFAGGGAEASGGRLRHRQRGAGGDTDVASRTAEAGHVAGVRRPQPAPALRFVP